MSHSDTQPVLTAERVEEVFRDCLFNDDELIDGKPPADMVEVEGIVGNYGFHPDRLQGHADEIQEMLRELPEAFMKSGGGGWSFLNACVDRHGNQWTGLQVLDELDCIDAALAALDAPDEPAPKSGLFAATGRDSREPPPAAHAPEVRP